MAHNEVRSVSFCDRKRTQSSHPLYSPPPYPPPPFPSSPPPRPPLYGHSLKVYVRQEASGVRLSASTLHRWTDTLHTYRDKCSFDPRRLSPFRVKGSSSLVGFLTSTGAHVRMRSRAGATSAVAITATAAKVFSRLEWGRWGR